MKALTLWQPWASLMAVGAKRVETRPWAPPRSLENQWIAIHAAQRTPPTERQFLNDAQVIRALRPSFPDAWLPGGHAHGVGTLQYWPRIGDPAGLPFGQIVAVGRLRFAMRTELATGIAASALTAFTTDERHFGNYAPGRWAWVFEEVLPLESPIAWSGLQRLWTVPAPLADRITLAASRGVHTGVR